jgi:DeoR/GlpR family transcriptional regulator of sugar metabolism
MKMPDSLFAQERYQQIIQILEEQRRATVAQLSGVLSVSEPTVRKDLARLEGQGVVVRTRGGAVLSTRHPMELAFDVRERLQRNEKRNIGEAARRLVQDGDCIALDASTTALYLARGLKDRRELTVVTNGIRVAMELASNPGITVLLTGGTLRWESLSVVGTWGGGVLEQIHIQKAFVGAKGFAMAEGLTDVNGDEAQLKRAITDRAKSVVALVDFSKWGQVALATFCATEHVGTIITDVLAPKDMVEEVRCRGIEVWMV